ncbi:MAG: CHRD domain-containing protein [Cyclobacterium sp.]|uniref:CHRD domain-containing protein n=1 Tax=Cyclobacterium sp. TaxID=1966343 RepID=UPI00397087C6
MKTIRLSIIILLLLAFITTACKKEDEGPRLIQKEYDLGLVSDPMISGTITFTKESETSTLVRIELEGTETGNMHPAHIHHNAASEGGGIAIGLNDVDGDSGISETTVTQTGDGTAINYEGLLDFDGHANVHLSSSAMSTLIAQGDIGSNAQANMPNDTNPDTNNDDGY